MVLDIITYALCRKNGGGGGGDNTHFIGTTTTAITDGAITNPITVDGESYTAVKGDIVIYDSTEFIFDGSAWQSFGGTMDAQPTKDSAKAVTSDGVYRYTAGQKEYTNNTLKGEIFNTYSGQYKNVASGDSSHAEGLSTTASGTGSHAEGGHTVASNEGSHAEGASTVASGQYSHAEGVRAEAIGFASHASGVHTIANTSASTVVGRYNVLDGTNENDPKHLLIVGNGTAFDSRSNILEVSDTYLNVNGDIKQNGQTLTHTPHVELTQSQYDALQNPDPNTEYFITNADASGDFSSIEDRMTAIEDEYTIVYMDGNVRIPLYTRNVYKVVRVDGNTVEWYIAEPTSQRNFKATVTATGSAGTRTNPTVTVTEVV